MKVFITGGSGFVGREVIRQLLAAGHQVRALVRDKERLKDVPDVAKIVGDTTRPETLQGQLADCDAVIHLVGIIREMRSKGVTFERLHTQSTVHMVTAARDQGVTRYLQMSANGVRNAAATEYHRTKWLAEEAVRNSDLDWTIFRPSLIFGPNDAFINILAGMVRRLPVLPVFGDGSYRLQPVHVQDVAAGFVAALTKPDSIRKTYHCCGPDSFSYDELLDAIAAALGKQSRVPKLHQPLWLMKPVVATLDSLPAFPITRDQLQMLLEGNTCADQEWCAAFGLEPKRLVPAMEKYLN